ncbi:MAG TPA: M48 family metallopeptidase [Longimicrobium sp.]|nr:M48 family metallopeptidase [Longimicrobium sp.]
MRGTLRGGRPPAGRPTRAAAAAALLPLLLGACISERREQAIGDQIASQVNAQVPLVYDVPLNRYVNELGRLIARHSDRPEARYYFYIVDTGSLNAFALPGGHIYVNRGLIERTSNVSELAGVLAHEIGHVAARHGAENLQRHLRSRSMAGVMYQMVLGREPLIDAEALELGGMMWSAHHSRADEQEADELAVRYLMATGVDPRGMLSLFSTLWEEEQHLPQGQQAASWFSTHPTTTARMDATRAHIRTLLPQAHGDLARDNKDYPAFLRRLGALPPPVGDILLPAGHPPVGPGGAAGAHP